MSDKSYDVEPQDRLNDVYRLMDLMPSTELLERAQKSKDWNEGPEGLEARFHRFLDAINDWPELSLRGYDEDGNEIWGERPGGWIHISKIPYFCERKEALLHLYPEMEERIDSRLRIIFDIGTAVHELFQDEYLGKMRVLKGNWRCPHCRKIVEGAYPKHQCRCRAECENNCIWPGGFGAKTRDCAKCPKGVDWELAETRVKNEHLKIKGRFDGLLVFKNDEAILEIKTINTRQFQYLKKPKPIHVLQQRVYMRLMDVEKGVIMYVDKGGDQFPKFFVTEQDHDQIGELFIRIKEYWKRWPETIEEGKLFPRECCQSKNDFMARYCPVKNLCFDSSIDEKHGVVEDAWGFADDE